jgi:lipopolysaccharide export system ATP-binding protein
MVLGVRVSIVGGLIDAQPAPGMVQEERSLNRGRLAVVSICKAFGDHHVLWDLSLEVAPGEVVGLLGRDGAGKTICFCIILGLMKPDSGRIEIGGIDVTQLPTYRRARLGLAYLPEEPSIFRGLTVFENIDAVAETCEPDPGSRAGKVERILRDFRLEALRDRDPASLSGGERRRVEVARAMAADPDIILLDEPFAGIDPLSIAEIKQVIIELKRRGVGVLVTDYDVHDLLEIVDRAYVIHEGRLIFTGTPHALLADTNVRHMFLGSDYPA